MRNWIRISIACVLCVCCVVMFQLRKTFSIVLHPQKIGISTIRLYDEERERPVITEIWYPIDKNLPAQNVSGLWVRCAEARDAPIRSCAKKYPLIVMSHGNGGDRFNNAWIAEILSANGYIVASMDHYGNTWNNRAADGFVKIWERPKDVSFVIDQILQDTRFSPYINPQKIGFIGYSLGGQTGIWIAGGQLIESDVPLLNHIPPEQIPKEITEDVLQNIDFAPAKASYRDPRIAALFLMAPALGHLFDINSLQSISVPVYIVASENDKITPLETSAKILASKIQKAAFTLIPGGAGHYVFLNEVSKGGKMMLDKNFALDPPTVNRKEIHNQIGRTVVHFFNKNLKN